MLIISQQEYLKAPLPPGWTQIDYRIPYPDDFIVSWIDGTAYKMQSIGYSKCRIIQYEGQWIWTKD